MQRKSLFCLFALCALLLPVFLLQAQSLPPVNPAGLSGDMITAGGQSASTLMERMAGRFADAGFQGNIGVDVVGTTEAFRRFCNNEVDIVNASREITPEESAACTANGRNPLAFRVANGAVVVGVSGQNSFLTAVNASELQQIFTALNWVNVRPDLPDNPINRFIPNAESDAFNIFAQKIFGGQTTSLVTGIGTQQIVNVSTRLQSVTGDPFGIGFFNSAGVQSAPNFRVVPINNISPNADTVTNGSYLLSFPVIIYADAALMQAQPQQAGLVNFVIENASADAAALGLFPASAADISAARSTWTQNANSVPVAPPPQATEQVLPTVPVAPPPEPTPTAEIIDAPTPEPDDSVFSPALDALEILVDARADIELFATETQGTGRPEGWGGIIAPDNPQLALLLRLDLEILAATLRGSDLPRDWQGAAPGTEYSIAADIRYDLEVLADAELGEGSRPSGWLGGDPLLRCDRSTRTLVSLLERGGVYNRSALPGDPDYCLQLQLEAVAFADVNLLSDNSGLSVLTPDSGGGALPGAVQIDTEFGVAFLDTNALLKVGVVPFQTVVNPVGRSTTLFSRMTLVQGENFLVFVDYQDTTMTEEQFEALPPFRSLNEEPFCGARFCGR